MKQTETYSDWDIIQKIIEGEQSLYEMIVRRYNPYLYKIGRSYNYSHEDTQDLMQDTFVDAYRNLKQFEGKSQFKTWISRIMMNNCFRKREKFSYKNEVMNNINEQAQPIFSSSVHETEKKIHNNELGKMIEIALERIPFDYRMAFTLREINGFNVAETADLLQISEPNVKIRLNRAKSMLRSELEKSYASQELYAFNLVYCDAIVQGVMDRIKQLK